MRALEYTRATSAEQAISVHGRNEATAFLAGGTTLLDLVKIDIMQPDRVVDVHRLGLDQIETLADGRTRIGAMVTNTQLAHHPRIKSDYTLLSQALLSGATTQLRNKATTGGNVMQRVRCNYFRDGVSACNKRAPGTGCAAIKGHNRSVHAVLGTSDSCIATHPSDMCVAMAAIGATVQVQGPNGNREIDFLDFHLLPGSTPWEEHALQADELITSVTLNAPIAANKSGYLKLRDRSSYQFALASSAVILVMDGQAIREARIAMGGVGTKPWRALEAERALHGAAAIPANFAKAAAVALRGAVPYSQNAYKILLAQQAIVRSLETLVSEGTR